MVQRRRCSKSEPLKTLTGKNGVLVYRRKKLGPFSEPCRLTIERNSGLLNFFRHRAICFQNIKQLRQIIARLNSVGDVASLGITGISCIPTATRGAAPKSCGYPQRFARRHSDIIVALCTKYAKGRYHLLLSTIMNMSIQKSFACV